MLLEAMENSVIVMWKYKNNHTELGKIEVCLQSGNNSPKCTYV